jgi:photoactive yellow protein
LWCDRELTEEEFKLSNLCDECEKVSEGIPGMSKEQLDTLPFGVVHLDRDGKVLAFNHAEKRLSGLPEREYIGRNFFTEIAPCSDVQDFKGRFTEFLNGNHLSERFDFAYRFRAYTVDVQITFLRVNQQMAFVLSRRVQR